MQREPLTRTRILDTALLMVDEQGLTVLSMRKLAQHLGVEAMSLYNHVSGKDDIVGGIVDLVMQQIDLPDQSAPWATAIRQSAISAYLALRRHPWAAGLVMDSQQPSPARLAWMNGILGSLREGGCSVELTHHAYHAIDSHIIGFSLWLASLPVGEPDLNDLAEKLVDEPPFRDLPWLQEHMRYHIDEPHLEPEYRGTEFEFGLDLILDGVQRLQERGLKGS